MSSGDKAYSHLWGVIQEWLDVLPYPPSQARLATRLGISRQLMSDWKLGRSHPNPEDLRALADEMSAVAGRDIHDRLLEAVNRDQGYLPSRRDRSAG